MADNIDVTPGTGKTVATDDVGGVQHQRVKLSLGADGIANDAVAGAGAVGVGVQRITLASDDPAVASLQAMQNATGPVLAPLAATPVSGTTASAMTGTTSTQVLAAPAAGLRNYVTTIIVSNAHATVGTDVQILDGNGGAVLATIPAAAGYGGAAITLPIPLKQPTVATRLDAKNVTTGASTNVTLIGYAGA